MLRYQHEGNVKLTVDEIACEIPVDAPKIIEKMIPTRDDRRRIVARAQFDFIVGMLTAKSRSPKKKTTLLLVHISTTLRILVSILWSLQKCEKSALCRIWK